MKSNDKAVKDWVMAGNYVGAVAAVEVLLLRCWNVAEVAAQMPALGKACGNEAIRAAGLNGDTRVQSLHDHMEAFGAGLGRQIADSRTAAQAT